MQSQQITDAWNTNAKQLQFDPKSKNVACCCSGGIFDLNGNAWGVFKEEDPKALPPPSTQLIVKLRDALNAESTDSIDVGTDKYMFCRSGQDSPNDPKYAVYKNKSVANSGLTIAASKKCIVCGIYRDGMLGTNNTNRVVCHAKILDTDSK